MGILNVTPDSFSDGGRYASTDEALRRAEEMIEEGAAIIDIGGESTRPGSRRVSEAEEIGRTAPVIEAITRRFDIPVSIDTSKAGVAEAAIAAGAEIINDISGLRFDESIAKVAAEHATGLVLMHSRGDFETMHSQPPVGEIIKEVTDDFRRSVAVAISSGVSPESIILDVGIGFGKSIDQNLELIAKLDTFAAEFPAHAMLVGASRKSFIGKLLGGSPPEERIIGSLAAAVAAAMNGAKILRVHDVGATVEALRITNAILAQN